MTVSGLDAGQATPFALGVSLAVISLVPLARAAGLSERIAFSAAGAVLVIWWLLPFKTMSAIAGRDLAMDFSAWTISGLMVVAGVTWLIVYNGDVVLGLGMRALGHVRALAVVKMAMAYPLRSRFRTGITLAMFTLVVFTIVVGATTSRAFLAAVVPAKAHQAGNEPFESYPVRGFDRPFLAHTSFGLGAMARGYDSPGEVWDAMGARLDLAVVDAFTVPRHSNWNFGPPPPFRLHGFFLEDQTFDPVPVVVRDPLSGTTRTLTVIGVLSDTAPQDMTGIWTSQDTATALFGSRATPTVLHVALAEGVDPAAAAGAMERSFLANGLEAKSTAAVLHDLVGASYTLNWLLLGFIGLGLVVGVAALGVISARSVVERRQQIGVLRAIGFQRGRVQMSFLLESSFIALTAIVVGSALGLTIAHNASIPRRR